MSLLSLVVVLLVVGVLLWLVNTQLGAYISPPILKVINVLVVVVVILWLLSVVGLLDGVRDIRVPSR